MEWYDFVEDLTNNLVHQRDHLEEPQLVVMELLGIVIWFYAKLQLSFLHLPMMILITIPELSKLLDISHSVDYLWLGYATTEQ